MPEGKLCLLTEVFQKQEKSEVKLQKLHLQRRKDKCLGCEAAETMKNA